MAEGVVVLALLVTAGLQYAAAIAIYVDARRNDLEQAAGYSLGAIYVPFVGLFVAWAYLHDRSRLLAERDGSRGE